MSVPSEEMSNWEGFKRSWSGLLEGVVSQPEPPPNYSFNSKERMDLDRHARDINDKFGYASVTRSVNYSLDRRRVPLNAHSRDGLVSNLQRANDLDEINDLHRVEMMHFMQGRNASGNNYGSCLVGVMAHKLSLTIWQISHGDKDIPEPPTW